MDGRKYISHHFETMAETIICWYLQENRIIPAFLRWCLSLPHRPGFFCSLATALAWGFGGWAVLPTRDTGRMSASFHDCSPLKLPTPAFVGALGPTGKWLLPFLVVLWSGRNNL